MEESKDFRHGRHCVSAMHVHLVFVTKYRRCILDGEAGRHPALPASCGGAPLEVIKPYIEQQATPS
jgi:REP element-mobilizing transposase RayT